MCAFYAYKFHRVHQRRRTHTHKSRVTLGVRAPRINTRSHSSVSEHKRTSVLVSAEEDLKRERGRENEWRRGRERREEGGWLRVQTKVSLQPAPRLHIMRLLALRAPWALRYLYPHSLSLSPRSPRNRLLSPLSCSLLDADSLRFVDVIHRGGYIWAECLVARCIKRNLPYLFSSRCSYVFPSVAQRSQFAFDDGVHLCEIISRLFFIWFRGSGNANTPYM